MSEPCVLISIPVKTICVFPTDKWLVNSPISKPDFSIPLRDVISMKEVVTPNSISRRSSKRVTTVYADIDKEQGVTPIEIAEQLESEVFQKVISDQRRTPKDEETETLIDTEDYS